jgi:putative hydroxymethylpyrimidine transport system permease protein
MRRWLLPAALIALLVGLWQIATSTGAIADALSLEDFLVPSPAEIADALWENRDLLADNAWVTLKEIVFGILAALLVGVGSAILMRRWRVLRDAAYPLIVASQTIPIVVISPILIVWFGYG